MSLKSVLIVATDVLTNGVQQSNSQNTTEEIEKEKKTDKTYKMDKKQSRKIVSIVARVEHEPLRETKEQVVQIHNGLDHGKTA